MSTASLHFTAALNFTALNFTVAVDERCTACGACLVTCPERALLAAPKRPASIDSRCTGCLACIEICPRDALTVQAVR